MRSTILLLITLPWMTKVSGNDVYRMELTVTSRLPAGNVPFDLRIDFGAILADAGLPGVLNPNSIEVINKSTDQQVPFARNEDFAYGDQGRLEWVIPDLWGGADFHSIQARSASE